MPASATSRHHALTAADACAELKTDAARGLSAEEVVRRREEYGPNVLPEETRKSLWAVFARQFLNPLIYVLFAAAVLAFALGKRGDALVILIVVVANAIIGTIQEGRAERSMAALRRLAALKTRVVRGGKEEEIEAADLVPGDIMLVAAGDAVAADARLIEAESLEAAEAALTGESLPVAKQTEPLPDDTLLADRQNMLYSGTHITAGRGRAVVIATGEQTEAGGIARLTTEAVEPKTPLELRMNRFGRQLVVFSLILFVVVVGAGMLRDLPLAETLLVAISQMVSVVPEGLPVALTVALAVGLQRMAAKRAIVRRLAAVETLGSTNVICSDKTGTLTRNEMTVTALNLPDGRRVAVSGAGYKPEGAFSSDGKDLNAAEDAGVRLLLEAGALCNDSSIKPPGDGSDAWQAAGDPTEAALLTLAMKAGLDPEKLRGEWPRKAEIPFDSAVKVMVTEHHHRDGARRVFFKGAPEVMLPLCGHIRRGEETAALDDDARKQWLEKAAKMADEALRVLAAAMVDDAEIKRGAAADQFSGRGIFLGLIGQMDPPREEAKTAVAACRAAGIRPLMVTGDHKATGLAVALTLGLAGDGDRAVDGRELEAMSDAELAAALDGIAVFARVHPAQKLRIVQALQAQHRVVAMTGDGVNDAPALARADVGVAMGITGTEVAKGAAKIVITDDNFATIVNAVEQGRLVYGNIQKLLLFLFATSLDEVIVLLAAMLGGLPLPLAAVQILWINIVTEGTLTLNLVMEGPEGDEMRRPPVDSKEPLITRAMLRRMAVMVPASVGVTLGYFIWRLSTGAPFALVQTETFTLLAMCQWFNVLNCESPLRSALQFRLFKNHWLLAGLLLAIGLQLAVIYTPPLNRLFHTVPVPILNLLLLTALASTVLWAEEIRKTFARRRNRA